MGGGRAGDLRQILFTQLRLAGGQVVRQAGQSAVAVERVLCGRNGAEWSDHNRVDSGKGLAWLTGIIQSLARVAWTRVGHGILLDRGRVRWWVIHPGGALQSLILTLSLPVGSITRSVVGPDTRLRGARVDMRRVCTDEAECLARERRGGPPSVHTGMVVTVSLGTSYPVGAGQTHDVGRCGGLKRLLSARAHFPSPADPCRPAGWILVTLEPFLSTVCGCGQHGMIAVH